MGHGQAEFSKQKHMCPAVPLAFPSSRVWLANLSGAALGPRVSTFDLYQSKKLLTSGDLGGCKVPSCTYFWRCWKGGGGGDQVCHHTQPVLCRTVGKEPRLSPSLQVCLCCSVPFGRIWLNLFKQRLSQGNSSWGGVNVLVSPIFRLLSWL